MQCVRVRREGPLTGGGVELLALSNPIGLEQQLLTQRAAAGCALRRVRVDGPAQRARAGVAQLGVVAQPRARRVGVGQRDAAGGLRLRAWYEGSRSLPPPPPPSSSSGGFQDDVVSERRNIMKRTTPSSEGDDVERTEDDHQLFIGRHERKITHPGPP